GSVAITGSVDGVPGTLVTLVKKGDSLSGTVRIPDAVYKITPASSDPRISSVANAARLLQLPSRATVIDDMRLNFPPEGEPTVPQGVKKRAADLNLDFAVGDDPSKPDVPPIIDVAIFWTTAAERAAGADEMSALAIQALQSLQDSLDAHQIRLAVALVHSGVIDYQETGNLQVDRDRLQNPSDGFMDQAITTRNERKADVVALIVENGGLLCGLSFIPEDLAADYSEFAMLVVARTCVMGSLSFAHEFGHILGARHDRFVEHSEKPLPDSHGMFYKCGEKVCRDIMAY